jgi:hypothetical protein
MDKQTKGIILATLAVGAATVSLYFALAGRPQKVKTVVACALRRGDQRPPARRPAGQRERQCHTDQEPERRLNQVVQRAADPSDVGSVVRQKFPEGVAGVGGGDARQVGGLPPSSAT